jgi:hypothetical protein
LLIASLVLHALAVSSDEVVFALQRAGFAARRREGVTILECGHRSVRVRDVPLLSADDLAAVLRAADLRYTDFLELLSEVHWRRRARFVSSRRRERSIAIGRRSPRARSWPATTDADEGQADRRAAAPYAGGAHA